jgi:hypothetical protein
MPCPYHSSRFYHPDNIWWRLQIIKLLIMLSSPPPVTSTLLDPNTLLNTLSLSSSLNVSDQVAQWNLTSNYYFIPEVHWAVNDYYTIYNISTHINSFSGPKYYWYNWLIFRRFFGVNEKRIELIKGYKKRQ